MTRVPLALRTPSRSLDRPLVRAVRRGQRKPGCGPSRGAPIRAVHVSYAPSRHIELGAKAEQKGRDNAGGRLREGRLGKWEGQRMEHGGRNKFQTALATPRR